MRAFHSNWTRPFFARNGADATYTVPPFDPFFTELEGNLGGKRVALFGSYGWGDGQWMRDWVKRADDAGALLIGDGLMAHETPDDDALAACRALGESLVKA